MRVLLAPGDRGCVAGRVGLALLFCLLGANARAAEDTCPFKVQPLDIGDVYRVGEKRIVEWRSELKQLGDAAPTRQAMADYAVNLLLRANALEASGADTEAGRMRRFVRGRLPDTDWRIQFQARQGDLGAIEARISWLRADPKIEAKLVCELALRGAVLGGAESQYRTAFCIPEREQALVHMRAAADRGHAAALEAIGRLCLNGAVTAQCSFDRLCRAAQAGRIGAASSVGWHLTGQKMGTGTDGAAWLQRAADAGDVIAQNNLGEWHERHDSVVHGQDLALHWYRKAAAGGLPAAMVNAARLLAVGDGLQCREAQAYLREAASKGLSQAQGWLTELDCAH